MNWEIWFWKAQADEEVDYFSSEKMSLNMF